MALRDPEAGASPLALFGAELRHYRTAAGLSQEQLGDRIGYSAALVGAVETARLPICRSGGRATSLPARRVNTSFL